MKKHIQILSVPRHGTSYLSFVLRRYHAPSTWDIKNKFIKHKSVCNEPFHHDALTIRKHDLDSKQFQIESLKLIEQMNESVIKNHSDHLITLSDNGLLDRFKKLDTYNIVLIRKNIFNATLSQAIAILKNEWTNHVNHDSIYVDMETFKQSLEHQIKSLLQISYNPCNFNYDQIIYFEDLSFNPREDYVRCNFHQRPIYQIGQIKIPDNLFKSPNKKKVAVNYDELFNFTTDFISNHKQDKLEFDNNILQHINFLKDK